jgi:hypothetical protein
MSDLGKTWQAVKDLLNQQEKQIKELVEAAEDLVEDFEQYLEVCMDERERESIAAMKVAIASAREEIE